MVASMLDEASTDRKLPTRFRILRWALEPFLMLHSRFMKPVRTRNSKRGLPFKINIPIRKSKQMFLLVFPLLVLNRPVG